MSELSKDGSEDEAKIEDIAKNQYGPGMSEAALKNMFTLWVDSMLFDTWYNKELSSRV